MIKQVKLQEYKSSVPVLLTEEQIVLLQRYSSQLEVKTSSKPGYYIICANSWVGKFSVPGLCVEVSPKIGVVDAFKLYLMGDGEANLDEIDSLNRIKDCHDLWDFVALLLLETTDQILRSGIRRKYAEFDRNNEYFQGQLLVASDIINNIPVRTGTYSRVSELTPDIPENQAIVLAFQILSYVVRDDISNRIRFMMGRLSNVSLPSVFPEVSHKHEQGFYRTVLFLVNLIKTAQQMNSSSFGISGFGLSMDMNKVFEGFVRERIRSVIEESDLHVPWKEASKRDLCKGITLIPDFLIRSPSRIVAICDCKYKVDWNFQNSDVYQMLAYLEGYRNVRKAVIFYPTTQLNVVVDFIEYPRSGNLYRIGIPIKDLLNDRCWDLVKNEILKINL